MEMLSSMPSGTVSLASTNTAAILEKCANIGTLTVNIAHEFQEALSLEAFIVHFPNFGVRTISHSVLNCSKRRGLWTATSSFLRATSRSAAVEYQLLVPPLRVRSGLLTRLPQNLPLPLLLPLPVVVPLVGAEPALRPQENVRCV